MKRVVEVLSQAHGQNLIFPLPSLNILHKYMFYLHLVSAPFCKLCNRMLTEWQHIFWGRERVLELVLATISGSWWSSIYRCIRFTVPQFFLLLLAQLAGDWGSKIIRFLSTICKDKEDFKSSYFSENKFISIQHMRKK